MFKKIHIANRGDNRSAAEVAAKAHVGAARVMPKPQPEWVAAKAHVGAARVMPEPHRVARAACAGD